MVQFCLVQDFSCKVQVYFALTFFIQWIAIGLVKANFYEIRLAEGVQRCYNGGDDSISQAHMSNIENGHSNITLENLFALHDILGVSMASFFVDIDGNQGLKEEKYAKGFIGLDDMIDALLLIKNNKLSTQILREPVKEE